METVFVGVGGNMGDVLASFGRARQLLLAHEQIAALRSSRVFSTAPVGQNAGAGYLNAAFEIVTTLEPVELLDVLMQTEQTMQRKRRMHWGPRTIDLDLVLYGERVVQEARLNVPHPAAWYRRFVLDPIADLNPDALHPTKEESVGQLIARLAPRPLRLLMLVHEHRIGEHLCAHLHEVFGGLIAVTWRPITEPGDVVPFEFVAWNVEQKLKVCPGAVRFEDLPIASRLDVSLLSGDAYTAITDIIKSASDEPQAIGAL